jgi:hypothetical protein
LKPEYAAVIRRIDVDGISVGEFAAETGTPQTTRRCGSTVLARRSDGASPRHAGRAPNTAASIAGATPGEATRHHEDEPDRGPGIVPDPRRALTLVVARTAGALAAIGARAPLARALVAGARRPAATRGGVVLGRRVRSAGAGFVGHLSSPSWAGPSDPRPRRRMTRAPLTRSRSLLRQAARKGAVRECVVARRARCGGGRRR